MHIKIAKIYIILILFLFSTVSMGDNKNITVPVLPKEAKDVIYSLLSEHLFHSAINEYLSEAASKQRIKNTKNKLRSIVKDNPLWLEFIILSNFQDKDRYNLYFDAKIMMVNLLFELDKTGNTLFRLAINENAVGYIRKEAIYLLDKGNHKKHFLRLIEPIIINSDISQHDNAEVQEKLLSIISHKKIIEALPLIESKILTLNTLNENTTLYRQNIQLIITGAVLGSKQVLTALITYII